MEYKNTEIKAAAKQLKEKFESLKDKRSILRAPELGALYERIKTLKSGEQRAAFGQEVNKLKNELEQMVKEVSQPKAAKLKPIDVTAPFDVNVKPADRPELLPAKDGSIHPMNQELNKILDIFYRMGFTA